MRPAIAADSAAGVVFHLRSAAATPAGGRSYDSWSLVRRTTAEPRPTIEVTTSRPLPSGSREYDADDVRMGAVEEDAGGCGVVRDVDPVAVHPELDRIEVGDAVIVLDEQDDWSGFLHPGVSIHTRHNQLCQSFRRHLVKCRL